MKVDKVIRTIDFNKAYKKLKKEHKNDIIEDIDNIIERLINFEITTQKSNHPLIGKNNHGIKDIHIRGNVILLYRYDSEILTITLVLKDIVDHKTLKNKYN